MSVSLIFDLTFADRKLPYKLHLAPKISGSLIRSNYCHFSFSKNRLYFEDGVNKNEQHAISEPFYLTFGSRTDKFHDVA